eukprot:scaffold157021_cov22-Tisochrysis_lutea.AAC.1
MEVHGSVPVDGNACLCPSARQFPSGAPCCPDTWVHSSVSVHNGVPVHGTVSAAPCCPGSCMGSVPRLSSSTDLPNHSRAPLYLPHPSPQG